jgi:ABC-type branched-subunit amino acid transport system permease subunit
MGFVSIEMWSGLESSTILVAAAFIGYMTFAGAVIGAMVVEYIRLMLMLLDDSMSIPREAILGGALILFSGLLEGAFGKQFNVASVFSPRLRF